MKTILLLHGALGSKEQMLPFADIIADKYYVHAFDFSGHGEKSADDHEFSIESMADELAEYMVEHKIEKPIVFGYSMGGYVALYHALTYPEKIDKIVTLATKFDWSAGHVEKEAIKLDIEEMKSKIPDFVNLLKQRHGENWEKVVTHTKGMMIALGRSILLNDISFPKIKTPAMLCIGDKDRMVSLSETENAVDLLADGSIRILADTSHPFERVSYDKLAELIGDFEERY